MDILQAVALGIVQGLTEFLPISSSGHLVLGQHLFGIQDPQLLFDVVLHLGTLFAVLIIFHQDVGDLFFEFWQIPAHFKEPGGLGRAWRERVRFRMLVLIIIGTIPTGLLGFFAKDLFESLFASTLAVGVALIITGAILMLTKYAQRSGREIHGFHSFDAAIIGLVQGLAITPGISRSGITISTALFLGLDRELAARFSFLLSIPAILGALVLQVGSAGPGQFGLVSLTAGFFASLSSGLVALALLLKIVRQGKLHYFSAYCLLIGLIAIVSSLVH